MLRYKLLLDTSFACLNQSKKPMYCDFVTLILSNLCKDFPRVEGVQYELYGN